MNGKLFRNIIIVLLYSKASGNSIQICSGICLCRILCLITAHLIFYATNIEGIRLNTECCMHSSIICDCQ